MIFSTKPKKVASTPMSNFIRNASSAEKNKVYKRVLKKASERQNDLVERVALAK
jgi:negative regulator of replication initiation